MRAALNKVCRTFQPYRSAGLATPIIDIPTKAQKVAAGFTALTSPMLEAQLPVSSALTDGMQLVHRPEGSAYIVMDGELRWVPNQKTWNNLFSKPAVTELPTAVIYPVGKVLTDGAYLANVKGDAKTYLIVDGTKRWISSMDAMARYGFSGPVRNVSAAELNAINDGPPISNPGYPFVGVNGTRVSNLQDSRIYFVLDNELREISSPVIFNNLFGSGNAGTLAYTQSLAGYVVGPAFTEATYLARLAGDPKIYLVIEGQKRWITSEAAFNSLGFDWSKIKTVSYAQLDALRDGPEIR
jgi:hypothetical protein